MSEDIFKTLCDAITKGADANMLVMIIAGELKEQRGEIAKLRLLLEHEETVRSKKLHKVIPVKQSFMRGSVMKVGDRVCTTGARRIPRDGTIVQVDHQRIRIQFDDGVTTWNKLSEVQRVQKTA